MLETLLILPLHFAPSIDSKNLAALLTFKIKIIGSETRKTIIHKLIVHTLPANGASLLKFKFKVIKL